MLAVPEGLGGTGALAENLANLPVPFGCPGLPGLGRGLSGRQVRPGEKGGDCVGKTKRGKGSKWLVVVDGQGVPLGGARASVPPAEVTLAASTLDTLKVPWQGRGRPKTRPKRLVADKAYDSDARRIKLGKRGIRLLVPHPATARRTGRNRQRLVFIIGAGGLWNAPSPGWATSDAWVVRTPGPGLLGFFHLACIIIALRQI